MTNLTDDMAAALRRGMPYLDNSGSPGGCDGKQSDCDHCGAITSARKAIATYDAAKAKERSTPKFLTADEINRTQLVAELALLRGLCMPAQQRDALNEAIEWLRGDYDPIPAPTLEVEPAPTKICVVCGGLGSAPDYVGLEMQCVEVECPSCNGTGNSTASSKEAKASSENGGELEAAIAAFRLVEPHAIINRAALAAAIGATRSARHEALTITDEMLERASEAFGNHQGCGDMRAAIEAALYTDTQVKTNG